MSNERPKREREFSPEEDITALKHDMKRMRVTGIASESPAAACRPAPPTELPSSSIALDSQRGDFVLRNGEQHVNGIPFHNPGLYSPHNGDRLPNSYESQSVHNCYAETNALLFALHCERTERTREKERARERK
eukprot:Rmarinus@m.11337